jgi:hypothetical protein
MTERSGAISLMVGEALHASRESVGVSTENLALTNRAIQVAGWMGALRSGDQGQAETAKTSLKQAMEALSQAVGHKIGNIEELGRLAANPPAGMASDRIEATRRAYWDMVDGLAVGTMGLMATDLKLRSAVETGNAEGVRSLLGSEVLVGGEKVVIDSAVTNGRVLEILSKGGGEGFDSIDGFI